MQKKSNKLWFLFVAAVYLSMPAASVYSSLLQKMQIYELTAHLFISVILSFSLVQYVKRTQLKQKREIPDKLLFVLLFIGANLLMAAVKAENYGFLWLLPMIMLAIGAGVEYAMVAYVVLLAQNILIHVNAISAWELVTTVIYGAFCIWLMQQKLTVRVLPYLFISMLSVDGILQILKRQFQLALLKKESSQMLIELLSVIVLEVFIFCYVKYREKQERFIADTVEEGTSSDEEVSTDIAEDGLSTENSFEEGEEVSEEGFSDEEDSADEDETFEEEEESDDEDETYGEEDSDDEDGTSDEEESDDEDETYDEEDSDDEDETYGEEDSDDEDGTSDEEDSDDEDETYDEEDSDDEDETYDEEDSVDEDETFEEKETSDDESSEEENDSESNTFPNNTLRSMEKDLSDILAADYSLRLRLQEYSEQLFKHSLRISNIAAEAADYMEGNVLLAQAGGLYHEIGRIVDEKNYINEGERLLREEGCSEELIAVVRQHTASEKPQTLEAAIVLLADYIISTSDYLEKAGRRKELSDEKLVNTIFQNRIDKGNLDESGMSEEQIEDLREYYVAEIFSI